MPGVDSGSGALASDDQMVAKALEHFCSASEQSYHQFLASFTHLSPGSGSGAASSGLPQHPAETERSARSSRGRGGHGAADAAEEEGRLREPDCVLPADQEEVRAFWISVRSGRPVRQGQAFKSEDLPCGLNQTERSSL
ncbi:uncharacterized protein iftap [Osmerus eperlanus]|uniref:uncharacterized protein iftap n=1 Tax=Osmerus eperlanus TaxID=29151 RepID=UPI002E11461B